MPSFTRKAIKDTFLTLLNERPLSQITVKDIVERCGINRNSFYYHYADLPSLIQEIVEEDAARIIKEYPTIDSVEDGLEIALKFALENKKAVQHLYHSSNRELFERYLMNICEYVVTTYINTAFPDARILDSDQEIIIRFYKCECFGQVMDWLNNGMSNDVLSQFKRLCGLRKGVVEELVRRCEEEAAR